MYTNSAWEPTNPPTTVPMLVENEPAAPNAPTCGVSVSPASRYCNPMPPAPAPIAADDDAFNCWYTSGDCDGAAPPEGTVSSAAAATTLDDAGEAMKSSVTHKYHPGTTAVYVPDGVSHPE